MKRAPYKYLFLFLFIYKKKDAKTASLITFIT
ncbi:hypothetical protein FLACOL7796_03397 [Flavobacterium collinsii]|uniref:Uncharacterized protein n=1 Tax=Flavobacterium collinsii TaxID=1114861 RepID=A0ABN7EQQ7_9FLAO|nr:hypothetical protein FLACOL7796_03397 [Flavobacterium collinsii]